MTLSEELSWRGLLEKTTLKDIKLIDSGSLSFYWGVDPSSDSMTIGNLATAMMVLRFMKSGHKAYLLVGGATGLIGDPDGKAAERTLLSIEQLNSNKQTITSQYQQIFNGQKFEIVDNYDWFKDLSYLTFLREIGKNVPMSQMLGREFVTSRLSNEGSGLSYAEFSYCLIQGYDFLRLFKDHGVTLQLAGSDQWGNSIAGVDLIRRMESKEANVWTSPLVIDRATGNKFGKTEAGAIWLDPKKTTPTAFYQFWINASDESVEDFLKIYTLLSKDEIESLMAEHTKDPKKRLAQKSLASEVTKLVHGEEQTNKAKAITAYLINEKNLSEASEEELAAIRIEIPSQKVSVNASVVDVLVSSGLASSNREAREFIAANAIYVNGQVFNGDNLSDKDFNSGRTIIRKGKAFKDSALLETN